MPLPDKEVFISQGLIVPFALMAASNIFLLRFVLNHRHLIGNAATTANGFLHLRGIWNSGLAILHIIRFFAASGLGLKAGKLHKEAFNRGNMKFDMEAMILAMALTFVIGLVPAFLSLRAYSRLPGRGNALSKYLFCMGIVAPFYESLCGALVGVIGAIIISVLYIIKIFMCL